MLKNSEVSNTVLRTRRMKKFKRSLTGWLFASPVILGIIIYTYVPAVQSIVYSFFDYNLFNRMDFVGFGNYIKLFAVDPDFWTVWFNTGVYALISVPLNLVLGYFTALLANKKARGVFVYRLLFYLPCIIPGVASGLLWLDLFDAGPTGLINKILESVGLPRATFFSAQNTSLATLIFTNIWGVGGSMVIWLAAFKNIPIELYESANLDGASALRKIISITIPLSTPMIFYNLVTGIIGSLQVSSTFIIGGGTGRGVGDSLYFIAVKIYHESFGGPFRMGYASALAWVLFLVIGVLTAVVFRTNKWVYYED